MNEPSSTSSSKSNFNWALLIGLCLGAAIVSIGISSAGNSIANRMPNTWHGNLHHTPGFQHQFPPVDSEFMTQWQVANLLGFNADELEDIIAGGELAGTYTTFQLERTEWVWAEHPINTDPFTPREMQPQTITVNHRIFSRQLLLDWLYNRIE
ncbi:MAG: hypothetical protein FWE21_04740 [Defluviitaleaceae bacterium]|nr:hypothetical protein [Defluviitaleaceae bacterium]